MAFFDKMIAAAAGRTPLWLDDADYAGRLLAGGAPPWLDASSCVAWRRKAQSLLSSDVITLPLGAVIGAFVESNAVLLEAMRARQRTLHPLKALLADNSLRTHLLELARALRASFVDTAFALECPSPRLLAAETARRAFGATAGGLDDDDVDAASVYVAEFLRQFGETAVDAVLLMESADTEPANDEAMALYQPVINVAAHYRWQLGLFAPQGRFAGVGPSFVVGRQVAPAGKHAGVIVDEEFWRSEVAPACPPHGFRYATIPAAVRPETVLARLAVLRQ